MSFFSLLQKIVIAFFIRTSHLNFFDLCIPIFTLPQQYGHSITSVIIEGADRAEIAADFWVSRLDSKIEIAKYNLMLIINNSLLGVLEDLLVVEGYEQPWLVRHNFFLEAGLGVGTQANLFIGFDQKDDVWMGVNISVNVDLVQLIPSIEKLGLLNDVFPELLEHTHQVVPMVLLIR